MDEIRISPFGGVAGRVLRDSMSFSTAISGIAIGLTVMAAWFLLDYSGLRILAQLLTQVILAVALARFALNGLAGEYRGTVFSGAGGSWGQALAVAGRYLVLNLMWAAPLVLVAWQSAASVLAPAAPSMTGAAADPGPGGLAAPPGGLAVMLPILGLLTSKPFLFSVGLLLMGLTVLPPVFLIVAVRSERFADIVSASHWRLIFAGCMDDLFALYSIYGGGLGTMLLIAIPAVLIGFAAGSEIGFLFAAGALAFFGGLMVSLLGRLCGFFAFGDEHGGWVRAPAPGMEDAPESPGSWRAGRSDEPPVAAPRQATTDAEAAPPPAGPAEPAADAHGLPPLLDAAEKVAAARRRFETDPDGAIRELAGLRDTHAPSPQVLHALAFCLHLAGRAPEALEAGRVAVPLCLARGNVALAAELFAALWKNARALGLEREQIDTLAAALAKSGDLGHAVSAFGLALTMDPGDRKAIKGLLQLADHRMHREGKAKDAARIYTFLLQYAPTSPFAEDMKRGLAEAESRLARAS
jgi:hypothetical protein